jgi:uracil permease
VCRRRLQWPLTNKQGEHVVTKTVVSGYLPNDRPEFGRLVLLGLQHVVTMFPATVFVALLCGFHPSTVLLGAGISTIVALILSRQGIGTFIPLFYGSSFSYIAAYLGVAKAMGHDVKFGVPAPDEVIAAAVERPAE